MLGKSLPSPWQGEPPRCPPRAGGAGGAASPIPSLSALLQEEIQQLKSKLEKVEKERNELRLNSDRLESRVGPSPGMGAARGRAPPATATSLLSPDHRADIGADGRTQHGRVGLAAAGRRDGREAARREGDEGPAGIQPCSHPPPPLPLVPVGLTVSPPQAKYDALKKQMESMEMEVMEARLIRAAELNGELDDDDSGSVPPWAQRGVPRAASPRSAPVSPCRRRVAAEIRAGGAGDRLHQEAAAAGAGGQAGGGAAGQEAAGAQGECRSALRSPPCPHGHPAALTPRPPCPQLADLQADGEESQRALQQLKKKCQRLAAELQDTKLHLEGQQGRNHDLEKKQRRWGCVAQWWCGDIALRASRRVLLPF